MPADLALLVAPMIPTSELSPMKLAQIERLGVARGGVAVDLAGEIGGNFAIARRV